MTTTWTTVPKSSPNLLLNSWTLGANWVQNGQTFTHTPGSSDNFFQAFTFQATTYYIQITVGGTTGTITIAAGGDVLPDIPAGSGTVIQTPVSFGGLDSVSINPSSDFDGNVANIAMGLGIPTFWNSISSPLLPSWVTLPKASGTSYTRIPKASDTTTTSYGTPYGLLLALLRPVSVTTDTWTRISAPATSWTEMPKPT